MAPNLIFQQRRNFVRTLVVGLIWMTAISILLSILPFSTRKAIQRVMNVKNEGPKIPPLLDATIKSLAEGLEARRFTSVELVEAYIARIKEAAEFRAVLQINPEAVDIARSLDEEREQSHRRGPLHGIPILVKDNIVTKDKLDASAGSYALLGAKPSVESSLIARLRDAGVIFLGKTNLSEWANFRGLSVSSGWSPRGGQTLGAYYPNSNPDGSSSGSAVAAALGLCTAALGTETFGSLIDPAEINNVVGYKPTRGLIANDGVIPISNRQDVIGTLTRTVEDAAYMLNNMAGRSDSDRRTWDIPFPKIPDFTSFCNTDLTGMVIGVPRNAFPSDSPAPILDSFTSALETLKSAGAKIVENANFTAADEFRKLNDQVKGIVRSSEFKRDIVNYLKTLATNPNGIHNAEDIIKFTKECLDEEYPAKDIGKFLWTQEEGIEVDSVKYKEMVNQELHFGGEGGILGAIEKHSLDVIVVPSTLGITNDLAAKMGFPVISVPLGFWPEGTPIKYDARDPRLVKVAPGIPYCLTIVGNAYSDGKILQVAYAFEQLAAVRAKGPLPFKVPKTELKDKM
ncbi:putative amidase [Nemania sp. FL0031]|nr:putative amidase [Nemania sp. FL0031]